MALSCVQVIVSCQKGLRSLAAAEQLSRAGYGTLAWINGGLDTAGADSLPTVDGKDLRYGGIGGVSQVPGCTCLSISHETEATACHGTQATACRMAICTSSALRTRFSQKLASSSKFQILELDKSLTPLRAYLQLLGWSDVQRAEDKAAGINKSAIFIKIVRLPGLHLCLHMLY